MKEKRMPRIICSIFLTLCVYVPALAGQPDSLNKLAGKWTYAQIVTNDVYIDDLTLEAGPKGLTGIMKYMDGENQKQDVFSNFELKSGGRVWFISTRPNGRVVKQMGTISEDGNSIKGNYNLGYGVGGRFVLDRVTDTAMPCISGKWEYHIVNIEGDDVVGDAYLLGDHTGIFEGYLYYRDIDTNNKTIKGTVTKNGKLHFNMYESSTISHDGTLAKDGIHAKGKWSSPKSGNGSFTMQKFSK